MHWSLRVYIITSLPTVCFQGINIFWSWYLGNLLPSAKNRSMVIHLFFTISTASIHLAYSLYLLLFLFLLCLLYLIFLIILCTGFFVWEMPPWRRINCFSFFQCKQKGCRIKVNTLADMLYEKLNAMVPVRKSTLHIPTVLFYGRRNESYSDTVICHFIVEVNRNTPKFKGNDFLLDKFPKLFSRLFKFVWIVDSDVLMLWKVTKCGHFYSSDSSGAVSAS